MITDLENESIKNFLTTCKASAVGVEDAALAAGLNPEVVKQALETGRKENDHVANGGRVRKAKVGALQFWRAYAEVRAIARGRALRIIENHAADDWKAERYLIEYMDEQDKAADDEVPGFYFMGRK